MNKVFLHGDLKDFGEEHTLAVSSPREAIKALIVNKPGFRQRIEQGEYRVIRKPRNGAEGLALEEVGLFVGMSETDLHIVPVPVGSKKAGVGKILLGVALIGAAIVTGGGAAVLAGQIGAFATGSAGLTMSLGLGMLGGAMVISGLATMMMPTPEAPDPNSGEEQPASFLFNGPVNVSQQGHPIPIVIGRYRVGSIVGSSGLSIEQLGTVRGGPAVDTSGPNAHRGGFVNWPNSANVL